MTACTPSPATLEAANRLALARLDDSAPSAVTRPQAGDSPERGAIRRGRIGRVAASQEGIASMASGEVGERTPALLGVGLAPATALQRPTPIRERRNRMRGPVVPHHSTAS